MKYLKAKAVKETVKANGKQIAKEALVAIDVRVGELIAQLCLVEKVKRISVNEVKQIFG